MARARPCRASIFAMIASKLTINARMPESVRVRLHLRWLGSRPGRVPVNGSERVSHESFKQTVSILLRDAAARAVGQGTLRARSPIEKLSTIAQFAGAF